MEELKFKAVYTRVGGEVAGYMNEKTYEAGSWIIGRDGMYQDLGYETDVFIHWAGEWSVQKNEEIYGSFKTMKAAKAYIQMWIRHNPKDL